MNCKIECIYLKPDKQQGGKFVEEACLLQGFGIVGDINGGKSNRHLSIMSQKIREELVKMNLKGICTEKFKPNLIISDNIELEEGLVFKVGKAEIRITSERKSCYYDCDIYTNGIKCHLYGIRFAEVVASGIIKSGDEITEKCDEINNLKNK